MDLIRKVLLELEAKLGPEAVDTVKVVGYDDPAVRYHLLLLAQAKLIDFEPELTKTGRIIRVVAFNPSWQGYEFLDSVRNDAVWNRVKTQVSDRGTALPFDLLKLLAVETLKKLFGL